MDPCVKKEYLEIVEVAGGVISLLAMTLALITEAKVKRIYRTARDITNSISTRFVGKFPENMDEIISLISSTKRRLVIMCDVPAYGHFSNPRGFAQYGLAIHGLLTREVKPSITVITYDHKKRLANSHNQFTKKYEEVVNGPAYKNYFEYHKNNPSIKHPKEPTKEGFCMWLEEKHIDFLKSLTKMGVQVYESSKDLKSFAWLSDDTAILSFHNYGNELREVSFRTSDQSLIEILNVFADTAKDDSVAYHLEA